MSTHSRKLSKAEIRRACTDDEGNTVPSVLLFEDVVKLLRVKPGTLREWIQKGYLEGSYRKRGKHLRFWRDRLIELFFNGKKWNSPNEESK